MNLQGLEPQASPNHIKSYDLVSSMAPSAAGRFLSQSQKHKLYSRAGTVGTPAGNRRKPTNNHETNRSSGILPRPKEFVYQSPYRTIGILIHVFLAGRGSSIFEVWAAAAAPKTIPDGGGRSPPPFGMVFGAAGPPRPPKSTISGRPKNHVLKTQV